jgi:hypothetical protein
MAQPKAALRLLRASQDHLAECRNSSLLGLDPGALARDVGAFAGRVAVLDDTPNPADLIALRPKPALTAADSTTPD